MKRQNSRAWETLSVPFSTGLFSSGSFVMCFFGPEPVADAGERFFDDGPGIPGIRSGYLI